MLLGSHLIDFFVGGEVLLILVTRGASLFPVLASSAAPVATSATTTTESTLASLASPIVVVPSVEVGSLVINLVGVLLSRVLLLALLIIIEETAPTATPSKRSAFLVLSATATVVASTFASTSVGSPLEFLVLVALVVPIVVAVLLLGGLLLLVSSIGVSFACSCLGLLHLKDSRRFG